MIYKKMMSVCMLFFCLLLGACSKDIAPGDYDATEVGQIKKVVPGVVLSKRAVNIHNKSTDNVPVTTATPSVPTDSDNRIVRSHGFEYVVRLNSGAIISVVQTEDVQLKAKQHVLVIYGNNTRVVPDEGNDDY